MKQYLNSCETIQFCMNAKLLQLPISFGVLLIAIFLSILTHSSHTNNSYILNVLAEYHVFIMLFLVFVSVLFGFVWSQILYQQISIHKNKNKNLLTLVKELMSSDERLVIELLVKKSTVMQSELSQYDNITRVRAHRVVSSLVSRGIIDKRKVGKQVQLFLSPRIEVLFSSKAA